MRTLVVGAAIVDLMMKVERLPKSGEDIPCKETKTVVGGCAYYVANTLRNLNCEHDLCVPVGSGSFADIIRRGMKEKGYEPMIEEPGEDNGYCLSLVEADGERTFITNRNGSLWKENIEHVNFDKIKEAKILSLASIFNCPLLDGKTLEKIFSFAKEHGMTITADMIMPRLGETLDDIAGALQYVDYFFPNYDEACLMTGEKDEAKVADKLFSYGIKNVVMKIGTRGCYIRNKDGVMIVPACKGITAVDTIGAGDNFASGFIAALLQGKDIKECAEYANCTAAIAVQHPGATSGVQNRQMVEDMLKKYKEDYK